MGSHEKYYAPSALIINLAMFGLIVFISFCSNNVNSQLLQVNDDYNTNLSQIINVRFGDHIDKKRMVIDLEHPTNLSYKTSEDGKVIQLNLPNATWDKTRILPKQNITGKIINFVYTPLRAGSKLTLKSDSPVTIRPPFFLLPHGKNGHRIVIDFIPLKTPKTKRPSLSLVASLDNTGALPRQTTETAQLSHHLNPYIQRAFPQNNPNREKSKPAQVITKGNQIPSRAGNTRQNQQMKSKNRSTYQIRDQQKKIKSFGLDNTYVRGSVGMQRANESANDGNGVYDQEWDPGFILSSAVGTRLEDGFRAEGGFFYANSTLKQVSGSWNGSLYNTERVQGDISSTTIMGNIVYDFQHNSKLTPYGMAGVGMSLLSLNDLNASNTAMANDMDLVAALQVGAGFSLDLDKRTKLEVGYRYFETQNPKFSDSTGTPFESVFASHNFLLGARVELY